MTSQEQAKAVVDSVAAQLPGVWLGGRQRAVLQQAITQALDAARRETWEAAARLMEEECRLDWRAITRITNFFKQQATAQADKEVRP